MLRNVRTRASIICMTFVKFNVRTPPIIADKDSIKECYKLAIHALFSFLTFSSFSSSHCKFLNKSSREYSASSKLFVITIASVGQTSVHKSQRIQISKLISYVSIIFPFFRRIRMFFPR